MQLFKRTLLASVVLFAGCKTEQPMQKISFITLDPGHFHAALVQKSMYPGVDSVVHVYAPEGNEVKAYLGLVESYNTRAEAPTSWKEEVYTGNDYFEKMLADKPGNVVVLAGNNKKKTEYISKSINAGLNVLADKPMVITTEAFNVLKDAFKTAAEKKVMLYDIMTERYEITSMLQRELSQLPGVFGTLEKGTPEDPAVVEETVHFFYKNVSGKPLIRPTWVFDVSQAGEALVDVSTHSVDLVQWVCFPDVTLDYTRDINVTSARRWPTLLSPAAFKQVTNADTYPDFLQSSLKDSVLNVYANGEINYTLKGVNVKVVALWDFASINNSGDTHYSLMRGSHAKLMIRQDSLTGYKPALFIQPADTTKAGSKAWQDELQTVFSRYPGVTVEKRAANEWEVIIDAKYKVGHEAHFGEVTKKYLQFLKDGSMPAWEVPNMIAKYYTTTEALRKAVSVEKR